MRRCELFAYGIAGLITLIFCGSLALLGFEKGANPEIHSFSDAFWLAVSVVLTVGVSPARPMTDEGRAVAAPRTQRSGGAPRTDRGAPQGRSDGRDRPA